MKLLLSLLIATNFLIVTGLPAYAISPNEALSQDIYKTDEPIREFRNTLELDYFLSTYHGHQELAMYKVYLKADIDCDDYAFELRDSAREKGFDIETEGFNKGEFDGRKYLKKAHLSCKTFIGNYVIIIDPITLEYWEWWKID